MISPVQHRKLSRWTRTQVVSRPKVEPVSLTDYMNYKRIKTTEESDQVIYDKLRSGRERVEKYARRALVNQVWDGFLEIAPGTTPYWGVLASIFARYFGYNPDPMDLPNPPMIMILGCYSTDESGTETLVDASTYWTSRFRDPGRIAQTIDTFWPDTAGRTFETFRVRYACGYITPFTATASSPVLSAPNHGKSVGDLVNIENRDGALPAGLAEYTDYYVVAADQVAGTLELSDTSGGSPISPSDAGTGVQFLDVLPDAFRRCILALAAEDKFGAGSKASRLRADMDVSGSSRYILREHLGDYRDIKI